MINSILTKLIRFKKITVRLKNWISKKINKKSNKYIENSKYSSILIKLCNYDKYKYF